MIRALLIMSLSTLLIACSSDEVKDNQPVTIEDLSSNRNNVEDARAKTYETDDSAISTFSELDNPQSPLSIRTIYFGYDSSDINPEYRSVIKAHAEYLVQNPNIVITLEGHADERGSREYNLALGEKRAQSIRQMMTLLGVAIRQIRLISYGEEQPQVEGHDDASWQQNRRVEISY